MSRPAGSTAGLPRRACTYVVGSSIAATHRKVGGGEGRACVARHQRIQQAALGDGHLCTAAAALAAALHLQALPKQELLLALLHVE